MYETKKQIQAKENDDILRGVFFSLLRHFSAAGASFLASCASFEGLAPFGASLVCAVPHELIATCVLGCAAGYFYIYGLSVITLRYIAAASAAGIAAYFFKRGFKREYYSYFGCASSFFAIFATGLILSLSVTVSAQELIIYAIEGAASAAASLMLFRFLSIGKGKKRISQLSGIEITSVLSVFCIFLLSLESFPISSFSLSVIIGAYCVITAATYGGEKYGSLTGICAGVILGFARHSSFVTGGLALGGLLTGIFGKKNRFLGSAVFILSIALAAFSSDASDGAAYIIFDVGIAAISFILSDIKLKKIFLELFAFSDSGTYLSGQRGVMKQKLKTAHDGMNEVAGVVKGIGGIYRRRSVPDAESSCMRVCSRVCLKCENYKNCIEECGGKDSLTEKLLSFSSSAFEKSESFEPFELCINPQRLVSELSVEREIYKNAMREAAKTGETVNIVADQFEGVAQLLNDLSVTPDGDDEYDPNLSQAAEQEIREKLDIAPLCCGVFRNTGGFIYCTMNLPSCKKPQPEHIRDAVSEALDVSFENPVFHRLGDGTINVTMCRKTRYKIDCGTHQISSDGGKWCGDSFDSFYDGKGNFYMLLSDGMGTGQRAAADSVLCCSLCSSLIKAGFGNDVIIKMINSAMLIRTGEESIATLDIAVVNLYDGTVSFFKAGASFSVVLKHLKLLKIEKPSLPIGILRESVFEKTEIKLRDGDSLVLMSDGVPINAVSVWKDILRASYGGDAGETADKLSKAALLNSEKDMPDDITVMCGMLHLND